MRPRDGIMVALGTEPRVTAMNTQPFASRASARVRGLAAVAVLVAGGGSVGLARPALAAPPTGDVFDILYYVTDEEGKRGRQMTQLDLQHFFNRARCECGQDVMARINITSQTGLDNVPIRIFAGTMCDTAQIGNNLQARPCVLLGSEFTNSFLGKNVYISFDPIWLTGGVASGSPQDVDVAVPSGSCDSGQGGGGIWICVENAEQTDCQPNEFVVQGSQNSNVMDGMGQALEFDFSAPFVSATNFRVAAGDGAIVVSWDGGATQDVNGYRVLCADADDNPVPGKGIELSSITDQNLGHIYFTAQNLCPDGPFGEGDDAAGDDSGTTGDAGLGTPWEMATTGTTGAEPGDCCSPGTDPGCNQGGCQVAVCAEDPECCSVVWDAGCADRAATLCDVCMGGTTGDTDDTGGGATSLTGGTATGGDPGGVDLPSTGIESLDWAYVCSGHLAFNAESARIDGLENGREYRILVVAYDRAGNPIAASDVLTAVPQETTDLWELCSGDVCGEGGFCACSTDARPPGALGLLGLGLLGLVRRSGRRRRPR